MRPDAIAATLAFALLLLHARPTMAAALSIVPSETEPARQYERRQWRVDTGRTYAHPFDPAEVSVDADLIGPGGQRVVVPAFWDEPTGKAGAFFVRFAPPLPGKYTMAVTVTDADGHRSAAGEPFTVDPTKSAGFARRAPNNRYFQFDNGQSFFLVGLNLCWPASPPAASWFDDAFATLRANGGNYARVWMARPGVTLEGVDEKLNQYNLKSGKFYDDVLAAGEAHGISVMLTLLNYREFVERDMWGPADWPNHPYNAARGGPATQPVDFFENPESRRLFKARLRYLVARYSAYRSVAFWELFNEQEGLPFTVSTEWNAEMADYLRQIDPARHLITTSSHPPAGVWKLPAMDLTQTHLYGDGTYSDLVGAFAKAEQANETFNKPHLIGEAGIDYHGGDTPFDPDGKGTSLHNTLWASMATGNAGTAMYWWWDSYVSPKNQWHEFKSIGQFAAAVDWAHRDYQPIDIDDVFNDNASAGARAAAADLMILPNGSWGDKNPPIIVIPPNGRPHMSPASYMYGPAHKDLFSPLQLEVTLPTACVLRLSASQVSDMAVVRVSIDDKPVRDVLFSALPGAAHVSKTAFNTEHRKYVADLTGTTEVPMPAGHHRVTLTTTAGDWITLSTIVFTQAIDAKYAHLTAYAVQDAHTKDTVLWLWDTRSNWKDDQIGDPPVNAAVKVVVPNLSEGMFDCMWVDTRTGLTVNREIASATGNRLQLQAPSFTRDIALRVSPH